MNKVVFAALVVLSAPALADDQETATSFMKCARIADDASRLGCYDRLATDLIELGLGSMAPAAGLATTSPPPPSAGVPQASQPPAPAAMPVSSPPEPQQQTVAASPAPVVVATPPATVASGKETSPAPTTGVDPGTAPAPAPPSGTVAASAPVTAASQVSQGNSEESFGIERTEEAQDKALKEINSRYVGEFTGWTGKTVFELENGQVWQQTRSGRMMWRADNPMITIKRGFMGGYRLSVEGVNKQVYVKRIK